MTDTAVHLVERAKRLLGLKSVEDAHPGAVMRRWTLRRVGSLRG
jgi:hypothetical protein